MKPLPSIALLAALSVVALPARAQDTPGDAAEPTVGMDPSSPQSGALPGGMAPRMGAPAGPDWRFDFHGMFTAPLRVGFNSREEARPGQSTMVLHSPPQVPDDLERFSHTGVVPQPYAQLNFSYGTNIVTGTASIVAMVPSVAAGFFDPSTQLGINDLFLTVTPDLGTQTSLTIHVGAFSNRYGAPGEYDEGRYGQPFIRTNGVGENVILAHAIDDFTLLVEQGIQGQTGKSGNGTVSDATNGFADPGMGASFVHHFHLGGSYKGLATLGAHYLVAGSQDDRAAQNYPDGRIDVLAADLRLKLRRFGHFYFGVANVEADNPRSVGRVIEILNAEGGAGLIRNYFGPDDLNIQTNPNGSLLILGGQYDLSIGRLVSYPVPFTGDGPDIVVSAFGTFTKSTSEYESLPNEPEYGDMTKYKAGFEGTYSLLPWLATSFRYDRVAPNTDEPRQAFAILSPRVIFRTGWQAHDQIVLQYSRFLYGDRVIVADGSPPLEDRLMPPGPNRIDPDENMLSLGQYVVVGHEERLR